MKKNSLLRAHSLVWFAAATVLAALFAAAQLLLMRSYDRIEQQATLATAAQIHEVLDHAGADLGQVLTDYAFWDSTYAFAKSGDQAYLASDLTAEAFATFELSAVAILDHSNRLRFGGSFDAQAKTLGPLKRGLAELLTAAEPSLSFRGEFGLAGLVQTDEGIYLIASEPILKSDHSGPVAGTMVFARLLNHESLARLGAVLPARLTLRLLDELPPAAQPAVRETPPGEPHAHIVDEEWTEARLVLADLAGRPVAVAAVRLPRTIHLQGRRTLTYFRIWASMLVVATAGLASFLLQRLDELSRHRDASEERLRHITDAMLDAVLFVDLTGRIQYATPSVRTLTGYEAEEMLGRRLLDFFDPEDQELAAEKIRETLHGVGAARFEVRHRHQRGSSVWLETVGTVVHGERGQSIGAVFGSRDVTLRKQYEAEVEHAALHDVLTQLPNRLLLQRRLEAALERARQHGSLMWVLYLDLDRFKSVNDSLGHDAGDELLIEVAERLKQCVRAEDTLARMGGDEFACVLDGVPRVQAVNVAQRMRETLLKPFRLRDQRLDVAVSIGIASFPEDGSTPVDLIRAADIAMYTAKREGVGIALYDDARNPYSRERLEFESSLHRAVEDESFCLVYQPILNLKTGRIEEFEGLVRWVRDGAIVPASAFIPMAEESSLIQEIDRLVLKKALEDLERWRLAGLGFRLAVNMSARSLRNPGLVQDIAAILKRFKVPAGALRIEVTETAALEDPLTTQKVLADLRSQGIGIALDDFGSGYSSLAYLRELPVDRLKIDRAFVSQMGRGVREEHLVRGTIALAHSLGLDVVAEGVESTEQLDWLQRHGCDFAQGHFIQEPARLDELLALRHHQLASWSEVPVAQDAKAS